eukprot:gene4788-8374_t
MDKLKNIKHKILVLSGKGGVGKSTVSSQLALSFLNSGLKVGVLDVDICGPSKFNSFNINNEGIPKILGVEGKEIFQCSEGWVPVYVDKEKRLSVMSIGFLLESSDDAVIWRGPKKHSMIKQFVEDVYWGELDILLIDTPPGTSDEHITLTEILSKSDPDGAIIVTTPQEVSLSDVRKEINFCKKLNIPIIGIVENMSGFSCPCCDEVTYIFSKGGGKILSKENNIDLLGTIPIDMNLSESEDSGIDFVSSFPDSVASKFLKEISTTILNKIEKKNEK